MFYCIFIRTVIYSIHSGNVENNIINLIGNLQLANNSYLRYEI